MRSIMDYKPYIKFYICAIIVLVAQIIASNLGLLKPIPRYISHTDTDVKILEKMQSSGLHLIYKDSKGEPQTVEVNLAEYALTKIDDVTTVNRWVENPEHREGIEIIKFLIWMSTTLVSVVLAIAIFPVSRSLYEDYKDYKLCYPTKPLINKRKR